MIWYLLTLNNVLEQKKYLSSYDIRDIVYLNSLKVSGGKTR